MLKPKRSKSVDWFFGFKLYLIFNDCGELRYIEHTTANTLPCAQGKLRFAETV